MVPSNGGQRGTRQITSAAAMSCNRRAPERGYRRAYSGTITVAARGSARTPPRLRKRRDVVASVARPSLRHGPRRRRSPLRRKGFKAHRLEAGSRNGARAAGGSRPVGLQPGEPSVRVSSSRGGRQLRLGLGENCPNSRCSSSSAFVGAMNFGLGSGAFCPRSPSRSSIWPRTALLSFIVVFSVAKALTNMALDGRQIVLAGNCVLVGGWLVALPVALPAHGHRPGTECWSRTCSSV